MSKSTLKGLVALKARKARIRKALKHTSLQYTLVAVLFKKASSLLFFILKDSRIILEIRSIFMSIKVETFNILHLFFV
jgi:hypothetical protein